MSPHFRVPHAILLLTILSIITIVSEGQNGGIYLKKQAYVRTGTEVKLSGTIKLLGNRMKPRRIDMATDVVCYQVNPDPKTEDVVGSKGKLANVLVYLKSATLDSYTFEQPESPAVLEHKGCRYVPHVLGMRVGQRLTILNNDPTYHNSHSAPGNVDWNQSQSPGSPPLKTTFSQTEILTFKDDLHPWQQAYVGVFTHPFFAISDESGNYRMEGVPPGRYTLVLRHETLGEKTFEVTVDPGEAKELSFTFDAEDH